MSGRDLTGERFGSLTAQRRADDYVSPSTGRRQQRWVCVCDCGRTRVVRRSNLVSGGSTSCGIGACRGYPDKPTYKAAHKRVQRARGKASDYRCVDCGEPAEEWSYRGGSPDEIRGPVPGRSDGYDYVSICAWSPNPDDYDPRCVQDHRARDRRVAGGHDGRAA